MGVARAFGVLRGFFLEGEVFDFGPGLLGVQVRGGVQHDPAALGRLGGFDLPAEDVVRQQPGAPVGIGAGFIERQARVKGEPLVAGQGLPLGQGFYQCVCSCIGVCWV